VTDVNAESEATLWGGMIINVNERLGRMVSASSIILLESPSEKKKRKSVIKRRRLVTLGDNFRQPWGVFRSLKQKL
jgi:hypothetical protein